MAVPRLSAATRTAADAARAVVPGGTAAEIAHDAVARFGPEPRGAG